MAFKRLSAALKMSILWLVGGGILGGLIGAIYWVINPARRLPNMNYPFWSSVTPLASALSVAGFVAGGVFAFLLSQRARGTSINRMRALTIAGWGAFAGFAAGAVANVGLLTILGAGTRVEWVLETAAICAIASLGAATGVLAIAKRAPELPGEGVSFKRLRGDRD